MEDFLSFDFLPEPLQVGEINFLSQKGPKKGSFLKYEKNPLIVDLSKGGTLLRPWKDGSYDTKITPKYQKLTCAETKNLFVPFSPDLTIWQHHQQ